MNCAVFFLIIYLISSDQMDAQVMKAVTCQLINPSDNLTIARDWPKYQVNANSIGNCINNIFSVDVSLLIVLMH